MCGIAGFFSSQIEFKAGDKYRNILYEIKKVFSTEDLTIREYIWADIVVLHIQGLRFGMLIMADSR